MNGWIQRLRGKALLRTPPQPVEEEALVRYAATIRIIIIDNTDAIF